MERVEERTKMPDKREYKIQERRNEPSIAVLI